MGLLADASANLEAATEEVVAKNRLVGAKVNATGELVELKFHTQAYRDMAPTELAAAITEVVNKARSQMAERVSKAYSPFMPDVASAEEIMSGDLDPFKLLDRLGIPSENPRH
ncbi:YbaB/EbfC family nucleoid-associated protein [Nocardiopsis alborubida]|uniref:YbaB/EbfC family nucleoid-associated protein n=1 Tax=Nocardiopsis alborubida TaxID=146802 RepID=A0A7X6RSE8_9ACTN|nr:YbaB/EbfC family nucleoid-associated protein [Nocardiopsis alborubida]NKZ00961.1 YbaB/EbfC family nucleoid-associated protein [Nocardiopsis alborubida]